MMSGNSATRRPRVLSTILLMFGAGIFLFILAELYKVLGVGMSYLGFLFLLYWAGIMRQSAKEFLPALLGALSGVGLAWLLVAAPSVFGSIAQYAGIAIMVAVVFVYLREEARLVANNATMLYLIFATVPELDVARNVVTMAKSISISAAYMGITAILVHRIRIRLDRSKGPRESVEPSE